MSESKTWVTRGFEGFSRGSMGNAGHNLYVSRAGVLQRIYQFDLNGDGYIDLVFSNDHDHGEKPPALSYRDPLGRCEAIQIPADGARAGTVADPQRRRLRRPRHRQLPQRPPPRPQRLRLLRRPRRL